MKKLIFPVIALAIVGMTLSGCGKKNAPVYKKDQEQSKSLKKA